MFNYAYLDMSFVFFFFVYALPIPKERRQSTTAVASGEGIVRQWPTLESQCPKKNNLLNTFVNKMY